MNMTQIDNNNGERRNLQGHGQLKKSEMTFATNTTKMLLDSQFMDKHLFSSDLMIISWINILFYLMNCLLTYFRHMHGHFSSLWMLLLLDYMITMI